jgi:hypothetical protein
MKIQVLLANTIGFLALLVATDAAFCQQQNFANQANTRVATTQPNRAYSHLNSWSAAQTRNTGCDCGRVHSVTRSPVGSGSRESGNRANGCIDCGQQITGYRTPVYNASVRNAPVQDAPLPAPVKKNPVQNAPVQNAPVQNAPVQNAPVQNTPLIQNAPAYPGYVAPACDKPVCESTDCGIAGYYGPSRYWYFNYENVIVQPYFTRNAAYFSNDPNNNNANGEGYLEVPFDWGYTYSPRIELGSMSECGGLGARIRYWHFDGDESLTANDPNGDIFVGFAEDDISDDIGVYDVDDALFTHSLQMDVLDAELAIQQRFWTFSGGLRWARMEQTYYGTELNVANPDRFESGHSFEGTGLTVAAEFLKPFSRSFSMFAKARTSFLYGQSGFFARNPDETSYLVNVNGNDLLSASELQIGVDWRRRMYSGHTLFVTFAIEGQYWNNGGTGAPTNNATFDEGNYQNAHPQDADFGFFGFNIGTGILF